MNKWDHNVVFIQATNQFLHFETVQSVDWLKHSQERINLCTEKTEYHCYASHVSPSINYSGYNEGGRLAMDF